MTARRRRGRVRLAGRAREMGWIDAAAPLLAATMLAYLNQITVSMQPSTVHATETDLRIFAGFLIGHDPALGCVADIDRSHVEAFKLWQRAQPGQTGKPFKASSFRRRMSLLKMFFIRIIEWEWDDAPARVPIFFGDVPKRDESLPKFLDDGDYAKFMRALAEEPTLFRRLGVELLARTGMRVGELCDLEHDAVTIIEQRAMADGSQSANSTTTATSPYTPTSSNSSPSIKPATGRSLPAGCSPAPKDRSTATPWTRWVKAIARRAGIGQRPPPQTPAHVGHPSHQPRHVDRSNRRPARTPIVGHDNALRQDLQQGRRRRIRIRRRQGRSALRPPVSHSKR